jgi:hypothetical protein
MRSLRSAQLVVMLLVGSFTTCIVAAYVLEIIGVKVNLPGIQLFLTCSLAALVGALVFGFGREFSALNLRARIWFWWPAATLVGTTVLVAAGAMVHPRGAALFVELSPAILFGGALGLLFAWCEHLGIMQRRASPNKSLERTREG